ncbi:MAG: hypothetical protein EAZ53_12245 [Bacteroidetes bacterium]|nr:MAG: hypothetical protein EAZ53_12245 [Bacteroidota bacterium]
MLSVVSHAQKSQGIGTNTPNPRAVLDISVESPATYPQGLLLPRLTTAERTALGAVAGLATGMSVYDTTVKNFYTWDGTAWKSTGSIVNTIVGIGGIVVSNVGGNFTVSGGSNWTKVGNDINYALGNVGIGSAIQSNAALKVQNFNATTNNVGILNKINNYTGIQSTVYGNWIDLTNSGSNKNRYGSYIDIIQGGTDTGESIVYGGTVLVGNPANAPAYFFKGVFSTNNGTRYGLHITGESQNYLSTNLGIGGINTGTSILEVFGQVTASAGYRTGVGLVNGGNQAGFDFVGTNEVSLRTGGVARLNINNNGVASFMGSNFILDGGLRIRNLSILGSVLTVDGNGNLGMGTISASQWQNNGQSIFYNTSFVGIGTTTPSNPLHLVAPSNTSILGMFEGNTGSSNPVNIRVKNNGSAGSALALEYGSGNLFAMTSNGLDQFALYSSVSNKEFVNYAPTTERFQISNSSGSVVINASATGIGVQTFTGYEALRIGGLNPSTPKGLVFPYITTAQMALLTVGGLTALDAGMLFFNTNTKDVEIWDGTQWQNKNGGSSSNDQYNWNVGGNTITGLSFVTMTGYGKIGTNENFPVAITTGNQPRIFVSTTGGVGIGFASNIMKSTLQVNGDVGLGDGTEIGNKPVVVWLKNASGAIRNQGEIVIVDPNTTAGFDDSFTVTNLMAHNSAIGVLTEQCNIGNVCKIAVSGIVSVKTSGTIIRGQHCVTALDVTSGLATSMAIPSNGSSIGVFLTQNSGVGASNRVLLK